MGRAQQTALGARDPSRTRPRVHTACGGWAASCCHRVLASAPGGLQVSWGKVSSLRLPSASPVFPDHLRALRTVREEGEQHRDTGAGWELGWE